MKTKPTASDAYLNALRAACTLLELHPGYEGMPALEVRSALKQCASDHGIPNGEPMQNFVQWAERALGL